MRVTLGPFKMGALVVLAILILAGLASVATYLLSERRVSTPIAVPNPSLVVPTDIAAVQHGQHLSGAIALCTQCHGANLTGMVVRDDATARVVAPNITRGGAVAAFSDADYARAIRDGVAPDGRPLWLMPADQYIRLSDLDLSSLIAYLRSMPPVSSTLPAQELRPLGRIQLALGQLQLIPARDVDHTGPRPPASPIAVTPEYGGYLVAIAGCARCHGPGLYGGSAPGTTQPAPDITTSGIGDWSEADFLRAMRSGRRPDGNTIDSAMPWSYYAQMSDLELRAIWAYLGVVPPRPTSGTG
jgi:cytochrome c553